MNHFFTVVSPLSVEPEKPAPNSSACRPPLFLASLEFYVARRAALRAGRFPAFADGLQRVRLQPNGDPGDGVHQHPTSSAYRHDRVLFLRRGRWQSNRGLLVRHTIEQHPGDQLGRTAARGEQRLRLKVGG